MNIALYCSIIAVDIKASDNYYNGQWSFSYFVYNWPHRKYSCFQWGENKLKMGQMVGKPMHDGARERARKQDI